MVLTIRISMKSLMLIICLTGFWGVIWAENPIVIQKTLQWQVEPESFDWSGQPCQRYRFEGGFYSEAQPDLPWFMTRFPVPSAGTLSVELIQIRMEGFEKAQCPGDAAVAEQISFETNIVRDRTGYVGVLSFIPVIRQGTSFQRVVDFTVRITHTPPSEVAFRGPTGTFQSVLADGMIYKIAVKENGIHRISQAFLRSLGINTDNLDPRKISIYGNGGGMLPFWANADRPDDLVENHIAVIGEEDGRFDSGDYILFYGQGPSRWVFNAAEGKFDFEKNIFDDKNYYFIKIGTQNGARTTLQNSLQEGVFLVEDFNDYARFEEDRRNLLHEWEGKATGSGLKWYGEKFKNQREKAYGNTFTFPNLKSDVPVRLEAEMALRAALSSRFEIDLNNQTFSSSSATGVIMSGPSDNITEYARISRLNTQTLLPNGNISLTLKYPYPSGAPDDSEGWLDWIQFNVRRDLVMTGRQMHFRSISSTGYPTSTFSVSGANSGIRIWDITDPLRPRQQESALSGSLLRFSVETDRLREFIAFDSSEGFLTPEAIGRIGNQNYHGLEGVDMVILYHPEFSEPARRLAEHRRSYSGLSVALVRIDSLYNEFSSGKADLTAIRDFAKLLHDRDPAFRYLLLFGDASFDFKDVYGLGSNFIPSFQREALNPLNAHPADDYFGLLSGDNPGNVLAGNMAVAVGRLTVTTAQQADDVVRKIIHYDTGSATYGDWRNRMVFVADDEDGNTHIRDANQVADMLGNLYPSLNIDKLYLDAYPQQSTSGGTFVPGVNEAIGRSMFRGILALTYFGHGGPKGLAQERICTINDINSWRNYDQMPLLITATCTFGGFDDPAFVTAGEEAFLNPQGGAIALFSTTRAVFANYNRELSEEALLQLFERTNGKLPTIGEALQNAKNSLSGNTALLSNSRKFSLIGDPALKLKIPEYQVVATKVNTRDVTIGVRDTIKALQQVSIEGEVRDLNGQLMNGFQGEVAPTMFDKPLQLNTLGQDAGSFPFPFSVLRSTLFRGRSTVSGGKFRFTFMVPKDIDYSFGLGKASFYAFDPARGIDAAGEYNQIVVGGTNDQAISDTRGPKVEVFMNTEEFIFGSITDANPELVVRLEDESGINVVGNSIGHDLEGKLNDDSQNTFLLNDFYESDLDDFTSGKARYPLFNLPEGRHRVRVKAWDVANNSSEGYTEFLVAKSPEVALQRVLNYPNPFTDFTCFQFDHNLAGQELDVQVQIFTISGRLVQTLEERKFSDGAFRLDDCIQWDGRDMYGDRLARGVYLYKVKVRTSTTGNTVLQGESEFEKLVILK